MPAAGYGGCAADPYGCSKPHPREREREWSIWAAHLQRITVFECLPRVNHRCVNRRLSTTVWVSTALSTVNRLTESTSHQTAPSVPESPKQRKLRSAARNARVHGVF